MINQTAQTLAKSKVVGWFQGRMEFGPRALGGGRFILGDPRAEETQKILNVARSTIPAVTHVDYSARIQTVHPHANPDYYDLITEFNPLTDCPVVVNTSFNVRGEPIVNTPTDGFRCFMGTGLDMLSIGDVVLYKTEQDVSLVEDYTDKFELD